jgi:hypothetical protein
LHESGISNTARATATSMMLLEEIILFPEVSNA